MNIDGVIGRQWRADGSGDRVLDSTYSVPFIIANRSYPVFAAIQLLALATYPSNEQSKQRCNTAAGMGRLLVLEAKENGKIAYRFPPQRRLDRNEARRRTIAAARTLQRKGFLAAGWAFTSWVLDGDLGTSRVNQKTLDDLVTGKRDFSSITDVDYEFEPPPKTNPLRRAIGLELPNFSSHADPRETLKNLEKRIWVRYLPALPLLFALEREARRYCGKSIPWIDDNRLGSSDPPDKGMFPITIPPLRYSGFPVLELLYQRQWINRVLHEAAWRRASLKQLYPEAHFLQLNPQQMP